MQKRERNSDCRLISANAVRIHATMVVRDRVITTDWFELFIEFYPIHITVKVLFKSEEN